ncbi:tyrosine-type recombinase/integrase [Candidatus Epulonipiscium viviparus]|uniref:tyrosine-type recombinase/integrase n=1 Tax=Candidatus Epulonipiscium viviparus TaxID=420336 RepID=UPI00273806ED|nr:tyrosine-type recombinase/integrase [Candidatus Epulopiscium viviparus]
MSTYKDNLEIIQMTQINDILDEMPDFVYDFMRGIEHTTSSSTRLGYLYDLRIFLDFVIKSNLIMGKINRIEITILDIQKLSPRNIEKFIVYLNSYEKIDIEGNKNIYKNSNRGKARKLSALKTMFKYFYKRGIINNNPVGVIEMPKRYEKTIIKLDADEIEDLIFVVESGEQLSPAQKRYHTKTKIRDVAIICLLLGTGIRVSECVGLNINDVDFKYNGIKITRKGGNESIIYFSKEVEQGLKNYYEIRKEKSSKDLDEPLFLSLQNRRISTRMVEVLVKKYAGLITKLKTITPHRLRATYGTRLYEETGDIYLVADILGHKDVNTTKKYYVNMDDKRRKNAANIVKLRQS